MLIVTAVPFGTLTTLVPPLVVKSSVIRNFIRSH
jgi:hypothetical protein